MINNSERFNPKVSFSCVFIHGNIHGVFYLVVWQFLGSNRQIKMHQLVHVVSVDTLKYVVHVIINNYIYIYIYIYIYMYTNAT